MPLKVYKDSMHFQVEAEFFYVKKSETQEENHIFLMCESCFFYKQNEIRSQFQPYPLGPVYHILSHTINGNKFSKLM